MELIPASDAPPPRKLRRYRVTNANAVRRQLAALYGEYRNGLVTDDHARTCAFLLRTLLESIRIDDLEDRVSKLEKPQ